MTFYNLLSLPSFQSGQVGEFRLSKWIRLDIALQGSAPGLRQLFGKYRACAIGDGKLGFVRLDGVRKPAH